MWTYHVRSHFARQTKLKNYVHVSISPMLLASTQCNERRFHRACRDLAPRPSTGHRWFQRVCMNLASHIQWLESLKCNVVLAWNHPTTGDSLTHIYVSSLMAGFVNCWCYFVSNDPWPKLHSVDIHLWWPSEEARFSLLSHFLGFRR
jgi:hypothetical protein